MKVLTFMAMIIVIINTALVMMLNLISKKSFNDREKSSPFECGFDPMTQARLPFSLQFFLIAVIFLIFDVEITLLIPMVKIMSMSNLMSYSITVTMFILILLLGTIHEWRQGALDWAK
uniref:NADH-ubiquinone oxidoreductase chain 3 n=1 Tax=Anomophysis sp. ASCT00116655 TaxID=2546572 RepID=A0A7G8JRX4_9CUCU|nr:NADH dehydrogenase subunit 3 [Anomophysis sp. ASCT00116655]